MLCQRKHTEKEIKATTLAMFSSPALVLPINLNTCDFVYMKLVMTNDKIAHMYVTKVIKMHLSSCTWKLNYLNSVYEDPGGQIGMHVILSSPDEIGK